MASEMNPISDVMHSIYYKLENFDHEIAIKFQEILVLMINISDSISNEDENYTMFAFESGAVSALVLKAMDDDKLTIEDLKELETIFKKWKELHINNSILTN